MNHFLQGISRPPEDLALGFFVSFVGLGEGGGEGSQNSGHRLVFACAGKNRALS